MATVIPAFDKFSGLRQGLNNFVAGRLQQQEKQLMAQQLEQIFGPQFAGVTNPIAAQLGARAFMNQQDIQGRLAVAGATPRAGKVVTRLGPDSKPQQFLVNAATGQDIAPLGEKPPTRPTVQVDISPQNIVTNTLKVRESFGNDPRIKDIRIAEKFTENVETAYKRSLTSKNLGPVDIALAKSFQKLTDLGSSVREGEFATTFEGQRLINKIRGKIQSVIKGGLGFTEDERREIRDLTRVLLNDSKKLFNQAIDETTVTAQELGLSTRAILGGREKFNIDTLSPTGEFRIGQTVTNNGRQMVITGFDTDGTPLGEPVR